MQNNQIFRPAVKKLAESFMPGRATKGVARHCRLTAGEHCRISEKLKAWPGKSQGKDKASILVSFTSILRWGDPPNSVQGRFNQSTS